MKSRITKNKAIEDISESSMGQYSIIMNKT
jgi:hypothetical protein